MKISKSKKELAIIISENGGWRDGAEFSALEESAGDIWFCKERPKYKIGLGIFSFNDFSGAINGRFEFANWHQTVLSRAEYFHLYPAPDADGWIEWSGGACPVDYGVSVEVRRESEVRIVRNPESINWVHYGTARDIIAYRLHKPERVKSTAVGDDETNLAAKEELESMEFCGPVTRSIPVPELKPPIEQLAAYYRNAKDYAERKQQEADAAKSDAEAKLKALELAGEALGLLVSPITAKQEQELVITDRWDLRVGDEVEAVVPNGGEVTAGELGVIVKLSHNGFWCDFPSQKFYWYYNTNFERGDVKLIRCP